MASIFDAMNPQTSSSPELMSAIDQSSDRITSLLQKNAQPRTPSMGDIGRSALRAWGGGQSYGQGIEAALQGEMQQEGQALGLGLQKVELLQRKNELLAQNGDPTAQKFKFLWDAYTEGLDPEKRVEFVNQLESDPEQFTAENAEHVFARAASGMQFGDPISGKDRYMLVGDQLIDVTGDMPSVAYDAPDTVAPDRELVQTFNEQTGMMEWTPRASAAGLPSKAPGEEGAVGFNEEEKLRKEYTTSIKGFEEQQRNFLSMQELSRDSTGANDIALVFSFFKTIDPQSTVREGEFDTAASAAGLPSQFVQAFAKLQEGQILPPVLRKQLVDAANKFMQQRYQDLDLLTQRYTTLSEEYGIDPARVIYDPRRSNAPAPMVPGGADDPDYDPLGIL